MRTLVWYRGKDLRTVRRHIPFRIQCLLESIASLAANLELLWREFAHSTLFDRPKLLEVTFRPEWRDFPWHSDEAGWRAWVAGQTGYPVVDATARACARPWFRLAAANVGRNYPRPIVDHAAARRRFLETAKKHLG